MFCLEKATFDVSLILLECLALGQICERASSHWSNHRKYAFFLRIAGREPSTELLLSTFFSKLLIRDKQKISKFLSIITSRYSNTYFSTNKGFQSFTNF